jgi:hypothetical protein
MNRRFLHINLARAIFLPIPFLPLICAIIFNWQAQSLHRHMREELKKGDLVTVYIPKNEIHWFKRGKELILPNGRAFDVQSYTVSGDFYSVTGLYDDKEIELARKQQQGEDNTGSNKITASIPVYVDFFFEPGEPVFISPALASLIFNAFSSPLSLQPKAVITPPPRNWFA